MAVLGPAGLARAGAPAVLVSAALIGWLVPRDVDRPRRSRVRVAAMFDVDHRFIDLPSGAHAHYIDEGTGETLLFLHGNPSCSFQWRNLVGELRGSIASACAR